jgi:carbon monoxide dehydrogenase subunit G
MKLEQSFTVGAPVEQVWQAVTDVENLARCLPGVDVASRDLDGSCHGTFALDLGGGETATSKGSLRVVVADASEHRATLSAKGTDARGEAGASAVVMATVEDAGGGSTRAEISADVDVTGPLAGSRMAEEIGRELFSEVVSCLQRRIEGAAPPVSAGGAPGAAGPDPRDPARTGSDVAAGADGEPVAPPRVLSGDVPAEAAEGASPSGDPDRVGTLGVSPPAPPGRQPPGTTGGAAGPEGTTEAPGEPAVPDAADAAIASAGGAAAEAASARAVPPDAQSASGGPAGPGAPSETPEPPAAAPRAPEPPPAPEPPQPEPALSRPDLPPTPAPPPDAATPPPPPPGDPAGRVPTAGGAGGTPPPPPTGPPPPAGGRPRGAEAPAEAPGERRGSIPPPSRPDLAASPSPSQDEPQEKSAKGKREKVADAAKGLDVGKMAKDAQGALSGLGERLKGLLSRGRGKD